MAHWAEQYIGLPYKVGQMDCARLAAKVKHEVFGEPIPSDIEQDRAASALGRAEQMADLMAEYLVPTSEPSEGDLVLMLSGGRPSHVGVFCVVNGQKSVLHAMEAAKMTVLHRIRDLPRIFLAVEGYYKWKT